MPKQPIHETTHQAAEGLADPPAQHADHSGQTGGSGGAGRPGVTVGDLIRPARPAMIATGLLTTLGALLSI
ncbi:hypothetical protein, partial [Actinomyces oris]|uniref:hypothetical protein n=1 Tax=Actinomyces oris TaxID=544580 RepID=UPI0028F0F3B1